MSDTITCAKCGDTLTDELLSTKPAQRKRCPKCGSTARVFSESLKTTITFSTTIHEEVITYPQTLLNVAKGLMDAGNYSITVVVSHMACEIATERVLSEAFTSKEILYLKDAVTSLLNGYNITMTEFVRCTPD